MEDDTGLELSLGLSCGGSSVKAKGKNENSSDTRTEEGGDRGNKLGNDFKSFLHAGVSKQDLGTATQRSDSVKPLENFFSDLSKAANDADTSRNFNGGGIWGGNNSRPADNEEDRRPDMNNKRRMFFDDINHQRKRDREAHHTDQHEKSKTSHISITTEDGSTAENEDVAESEVEGSTSKLVLHHDDGSKRFIRGGGSSEVTKENRGFADSSIMDLQGQKRFSGSSESEFKMGNLTYGLPFPVQSVNVMNVPYSLPTKESNSVGVPSTSSAHPLTGMMQMMPTANGERSGNQPLTPGNLPLMFGYSPVQLPMLDKDNSWGLVSHPQHLHPYAGRGPANSDKHNDGLKISQAMHVISHNASEATQYDGKTLERAKGDDKQHATEEGSSSHTEEDVKGSSTNLRAKDASDRSTAEGFSLDFSAIKPGIAAELKFGGCGSYPDLPWVSTTAPGPNGRTISGVTYRFSANQIKIVCACHGTHMLPEEFVRHAADGNANPDNGTGLATFPNSNPAASAQS